MQISVFSALFYLAIIIMKKHQFNNGDTEVENEMILLSGFLADLLLHHGGKLHGNPGRTADPNHSN